MKYSTFLGFLFTLLMAPCMTHAFDSGSTGADGAFNPATNTTLALPPSGIFNFTEINIPAGVTVTFERNATNTPVVLLASGDATIEGTIDIRGGDTVEVGDADRTNDGFPGVGGPGGFDGGKGGFIITTGGDAATNDGGSGKGPGGGNPGTTDINGGEVNNGCGGGGGGFNGNGSDSPNSNCRNKGALGGSTYGVASLIPLAGGSGGGGGAGSRFYVGSGGGGGGGALLLAASGTLTINGTITANGGNSGTITSANNSFQSSGTGGGGSGGAIRLMATTLTGNGPIRANGGQNGINNQCGSSCYGGDGAVGRIRLEAENLLRTAPTSPAFSAAPPNPVFIASLPNIQITSIGGIAAPAAPTGDNDVVLPENTPNPVDVVFATTDIPAGGTIVLTAKPNQGFTVTANSTPIAADGSATASINLPNGPSVLTATTTFTVVASLGTDFSKYAQGKQVKQVKVAINSQGLSETTFITANGEEFTWLSNAVAMN